MQRFRGFRPAPPQEYINKAITNAGEEPDYEGVLFSDGTVCVRWLTQYRSHSVWANWEAFFQVPFKCMGILNTGRGSYGSTKRKRHH